MSSAIVLNPGGIRVLSMRLLQPYTGVWLADLELDPGQVALAPKSGKVTLTIGDPVPLATLAGTVDPRGSGAFVEFVHMRALGGGAGWDKTVSAKHYHSDGVGLLNSRVYSTTAIEVGEVVAVAVPVAIGNDFVRSMGPASRVLDGQDWWVDLKGVTQVGPRLPAVADASTTLIRWDPSTQVAELTCDTLFLPGTVIADPRLPDPVTARDVEQVFDAHGSKVTAWCALSPTAQLMGDLRSMVVEFSGRKYLATYPYRVVSQNSDGRLQLQALHKADGYPDALPVSPWTGLSGASAKLLPGSTVRVAFLNTDPSQPIVDSYDPTSLPLESTVDAKAAVHIGPAALAVALAGGTVPLVPAPWGTALVVALEAFAAAMNTAAGSVPILAPLVLVATGLTTALGALPPGATTKTVAA